MMALYYAKIQASQSELESEMRLHVATASALRAATEEAERAGAAKAEFLAKMSHELRTPLHAVIGYSQILLENAEVEGDNESMADLVKIHAAGQHLLELINEVLDLSKIEAGKMELDLKETDLTGLLIEIAESAKSAAENNRNEFVSSISPNLGTALCDVSKFRNMVGQLLDNAAKFTQSGKIEFAARRLIGETGEHLVVNVIDTGIGIAPDQMTNLFEKFTVTDDSSTSKYGGPGLGLALSQRLCRLMGGEVSVESELGKGSRFTIRLPLVVGGRKEDLYSAATLVPEVSNLTLQPDAEMPNV
jgi:signal transduction histidine kinase